MELQFQKQVRDCLQLWADGVKNEEQTQEIKLPDTMPDIGTVLGAWGQALIRSKEWRSSGMSISGGVMTWVLYSPEDGGTVQMVEGWIPFQMRWDFPEAQYDGKIIASCLLRSVDARCVSARRLMVRAGISVLAEALEPSQITWYAPGEIPADVQLLKKSWPVCLSAEAGEKIFQLDEELSLPADCGDASKILRCELQPEIIDRKIMGDRVVFRGIGLFRALLLCGEAVKDCSFEIPFSQYTQLDREYGGDAWARVMGAVTNLEPELDESGKLRLKAGLTGQYVIYDRSVLELVEDAYSPEREVSVRMGSMEMPLILEHRREVLRAEQTIPSADGEIVDICFTLGQPAQLRDPNGVQLEMPGSFTLLQRTEQGALQGAAAKWEGKCALNADRDTAMIAWCAPSGSPQASQSPDGAQVWCDVAYEFMSVCPKGLSMITALELGQQREPDPGRPALILQRAGDRELWHIAKETGSTVDAIRRVNGLPGEPQPDKMLLIPVL